MASAPSGRTRSDSFSIPRRKFVSTARGRARSRVSTRLKRILHGWEGARYHGLDGYTAIPYSGGMAADAAFDRLNERQREAAAFGAAPLLIIAGAGTGKTNTLAHRVAHLVLQGVSPQRILLLTFSRRAALEMTRRAQRIVGEVVSEVRL